MTSWVTQQNFFIWDYSLPLGGVFARGDRFSNHRTGPVPQFVCKRTFGQISANLWAFECEQNA